MQRKENKHVLEWKTLSEPPVKSTEGSITALSDANGMRAQLKQVLRTKQTFHSTSSQFMGDFNLSFLPQVLYTNCDGVWNNWNREMPERK